MLRFAEKVLEYSRGLNRQLFEDEELRYDAILRNLEFIGEAATHVPEDVRQCRPALPWRQVVATRNRLIHGYLGIDNDILWSIVSGDIPLLVTELRAFLDTTF